jgi:nucleoside permease NupC
MLPLCSILLLSTVHRVQVRLGIIAAFTVVFSLGLGLVTGARRVEIFSAAAAYVCDQIEEPVLTSNSYAAVQVVFIAGNGPDDGPANVPSSPF